MDMKDRSLLQLEKIPIIERVERIPLTSFIKSRLGVKLARVAHDNEKHIRVYRIVYKSNNHQVVGFIIEPCKGSKRPCIIYNRGGSENIGALKIGELFVDLAVFARHGYIVAASQYSGNGGSEGKDEQGGKDVDDVLNLYEILRRYPRADASRVGMYGRSRGGMMTYLCLAKVKWIRAAVTVAGVANLIRSAKRRPDIRPYYRRAFGTSVIAKKRRSALFWPEKLSKKTPVLMLHGTGDWRISPLDSIELSAAMYKHRVPHRLVLFEGADHSLTEFREEAEAMILNWFDVYLKQKPPLPDLRPHGA